MKPDQTIYFQLVGQSGEPLKISNVFVDIGFFTGGRYRYGFRFKTPTDNYGQLRVKYEDVESERVSNAKECLMDYNTPLSECDARIRVSVPTFETLQENFEISTRWAGHGAPPEYAKNWLTANNGKITATEIFVNLNDPEASIKIPCCVVTK